METHFFSDDKNRQYCGVLDVEEFVKKRGPKGIEKFSKWIDRNMNDFRANAKDNKKISMLRQKFTIANFLRDNDGLAWDRDRAESVLSKKEIYKVRIPVKIENRKKHDIMPHVKLPNNRLYIPGSSIKGAMRTALISTMIGRMGSQRREDFFKKIYGNVQRGGKNFDDPEEMFLKELFDFGSTNKNWQNYDFMRFISFSDCLPYKDKRELCQVATVTLKKDRSGRKTENKQEINIFEVIPAQSRYLFKASVDIDLLNAQQKKVGDKNKLAEKFELAFGHSLSKILQMDKEEAEDVLVRELLQSSHEHGKIVFNRDMDWSIKNFGDSSAEARALDLVEDVASDKSVEHSSLIKLGYGSGFVADTIYGVAMKSNYGKDLYREVFAKKLLHLPINKRKNAREQARNIKESTLQGFPSSRRLIIKLPGGRMAALGWGKLYYHDTLKGT